MMLSRALGQAVWLIVALGMSSFAAVGCIGGDPCGGDVDADGDGVCASYDCNDQDPNNTDVCGATPSPGVEEGPESGR
jgi:hypothetical protein